MRLLMVAPPGAGKGTQAVRLAEHYGIAHLSSGDLFRAEVSAKSAIGRIAAGYLKRGDLVPDDLVMQILAGPVLTAARSGGYVLDGFPRTLRQAQEAYEWAQQVGDVELQAVVHLRVSRPELRRRMLERAHDQGRTDDTPATIDHRLDVYDHETEPLLGFYSARGLVVNVEGEKAVGEVFADIVAQVDAVRDGKQ